MIVALFSAAAKIEGFTEFLEIDIVKHDGCSVPGGGRVDCFELRLPTAESIAA